MRLNLLHSDHLSEALRKHIQRLRPLLATMPPHKQAHARRVGQSLKRAGVNRAGIVAGILHDYLERGGTLTELQAHLDELAIQPHAIEVIQALTNHDKDEPDEAVTNQTLTHLRQTLPGLESTIRDLAILTKLADRLDNLRRRAKRGRIGRNYRRKSVELIRYLGSIYDGPIRYFKYLADAITELVDIPQLSYS